jgi:hypothetical protein
MVVSTNGDSLMPRAVQDQVRDLRSELQTPFAASRRGRATTGPAYAPPGGLVTWHPPAGRFAHPALILAAEALATAGFITGCAASFVVALALLGWLP